MTFTFPLLLGGMALVGVPVLLHFLLRQKPKVVLFPAFRFLAQRQKSNLTKLRLKHLLLLALRVLLLAAICLALARPKIKDNPWTLPSDQAVAAVFVFDTSASMEYTITANQSRLKDAQKRAVEMLKLLPDGTEVVVLDSADSAPLGKGEWLSQAKAFERIDRLQIAPANAPVSARVMAALDLLGRTAKTKDEDQRWQRARVLCVFSDRTTAAWDVGEGKSLQASANQIPPLFERLAAVRGGLTALQQQVKELPTRMPDVSTSFAEQPLLDALEKLGERIGQVRVEDYPDEPLQAILAIARTRSVELLQALQKNKASSETQEYRDKLTAALQTLLRNSSGFTGLYVDVGVEEPADLRVSELQLRRDLPVNGSQPAIKLRAKIQATGEDYPATLTCQGEVVKGKAALQLKAGQYDYANFDVDENRVKPGEWYQAKISAEPSDQLPIDNSRYLTFTVRRLLVVTDPANQAEANQWAAALTANRFDEAMYHCDVKTPATLGDRFAEGYAAVFLWGLKSPDAKLWSELAEYVGKGGGLCVIPGGEEMSVEAYNDAKAQEVLPGRLETVVAGKGAEWDWSQDIYKHPLMHPYLEWKQGKYDMFVEPRLAFQFWQIKPQPSAGVLVHYAESEGKGRPALLERIIDLKRGRSGRVLLLTTPPGRPKWNNYLEDKNSFYPALAGRAVGWLTGDVDRPSLNFIAGKGVPLVSVPIFEQQTMTYKVFRDGTVPVGMVTVDARQNAVRVPQATAPGNYTLKPGDGADPTVWFSVNLPAEECDLTRTPKGEIEAVLGPDAVLAPAATGNLDAELGGQISRPLDLMPLLMLVVLIALAVENLLANRFYCKEAAQ
jgi:hypothetical protein